MSGARVLVRCFSPAWTGNGLFFVVRCWMMERFCCLFSQPPSLPPSAWYLFPCSAFWRYHLPSLHLVPIFWRIVMENVVPQKLCRCFLAICLLSFFPLSPLLASQWFTSLCAPQRRGEKKGKTCVFPFPPNSFYSSNPLKKWQKKKFQSNVLNCVYCRDFCLWSLVCCLL